MASPPNRRTAGAGHDTAPDPETVALLTEILISHQHALEACSAAGDRIGTAHHANVIAQLGARSSAPLPIPDLPGAVRLPQPARPEE